MPYTVEVPGHGVVEVPDGVSLQQAQIEIEKAFPYTGEDIAGAMQDPSFTPTKSFLPEQNPHPFASFPARELNRASHSCPE